MCLCSRFYLTFALLACPTTSSFRWPLWPCTRNPAANPWLGSATSLPAPRNGFSPVQQYHLIRGRWVLQARQQCSMYDLNPPSLDIFKKSWLSLKQFPCPSSNYTDRHQHSDWSYIRVTRVSLAWWLSGITGPWALIMLMPGLLFEPWACLGQIKTWWQ